ncbi:MAG: TIGR02281 family clan AA aspartic protease [Gammaproteobacteria bacterium]|nr:MAG: TIGR02281 family clan AA aspartic protease [Gammaproteobacteria bacterium]
MADPDKYSTSRLGKGMTLAAWIIALGLLTLFFNNRLDRQRNPNQSVYSRIDDAGRPEVILKRNRFGHYITNGTVNGRSVEFILDTGASDVAVPAELAQELGLKRGAPVQYQTANGVVTAYRTTIDSVTIGPLIIRNVPASINPGMRDMEILLGMSVLKHIEFTQRGDTLILRPNE